MRVALKQNRTPNDGQVQRMQKSFYGKQVFRQRRQDLSTTDIGVPGIDLGVESVGEVWGKLCSRVGTPVPIKTTPGWINLSQAAFHI